MILVPDWFILIPISDFYLKF